MLKSLIRWQKGAIADYVRLLLPRRHQNFGFEQQVWGHENAPHSPELRQRARKLTGDCCACCSYVSEHNSLIFDDCDPSNQASKNLRVACAICIYNYRLNLLSANDGVMVYLPELAPADLSLLMRAVVQAKKYGDERQKTGATAVIRWLTAHRKEVEFFWGTSHPGEFGQALMQGTARMREDLQQRLRHIALIPSPELIARHIGPLSHPPEGWSSLLDQYNRQS
jgi:hypothetical protein